MKKVKSKKVIEQKVEVAVAQRERVKKLLTTIDSSWFELSSELRDIHDSWRYKEWGYEEFRDYVEKELKIEYRIAMYRVSIAKAIEQYKIKKEEVMRLGWTKFKELIPFFTANKKQREDLIKKAEQLTVKELQVMLKPKGVNKGGNKYSFVFNDDQQEVVLQAFEIAEVLLKTKDRNRLLEAIISEWLSTHI